jgi:magnesium chelatase subunit D
MSEGAAIWSDAMLAAALIAVDPVGLGGVRLHGGAGPIRDRWLEIFRSCLPATTPIRKLPPAISDGRLLGGIDLAATLQSGRPVVERGLLAEIDGGVLLAVMAERLEASTVAHLNAVLDAHEVVVERDGLSLRQPSAFALVALDEGIDDEEAAASLRDRLAFSIELGGLSQAGLTAPSYDADFVQDARGRLRRVTIADEFIEVLCAAAVSLGITSLRAPLLAIRAARAVAALAGETAVRRDDVEAAARLVLAPRATMLPAPAEQQAEQQQPDDSGQSDQDQRDQAPLDDVILDAAQAAIPPDILRQIQDQTLGRRRSATAGKQGTARNDPRRGRPIGVRRGELRAGARLNVLETLRVAAPWQPLRRKTRGAAENAAAGRSRLLIEKDDFRITRFRQRSATSTIFVVDASGSSALQRLAEVKGAVELMLADCYIRRDEVALIAFRGTDAGLLLPPTRSLTRAKRSLAALPGGGGTPLSKAIDAAAKLALAIRSKGQSPTIVLMTDGRANVSRDGQGGRAVAEAEAQEAARQLGATGIPVVLVDTSPRPQASAEKLANAMHARYVALPYADAARLSRAVQAHVAAS